MNPRLPPKGHYTVRGCQHHFFTACTERKVCDDAAKARICGGACARASCRDYPEAVCKPDNCVDCTPEWYVDGEKVANCNNRTFTCPGVWAVKGNHCYRVQNRYALTQKQAQKYCLRQGGHLVTIESSAEQTLVSDLLLLDNQAYWTAGHKYQSSSRWIWQTPEGNEPMTYTYWASGEPNDSGYRGFPENGVTLKQQGRYWKWNDESEAMRHLSICEAEPSKVQTLCDSKPCMNGGDCVTNSEDRYTCNCRNGFVGKYCELQNDNSKWNRHGNSLYLFVTDFALNYYDASAYCAMSDAYLVSINNKEESDFIKSQLAKLGMRYPTRSFSTGGYKLYQGSSSIRWADGTATPSSGGFKDWGYSEPNNGGGKERYIRLKYFYESNSWKWNDTPGHWTSEFICEKPVYWGTRRSLEDKSSMLRRLYAKRWTDVDGTKEY